MRLTSRRLFATLLAFFALSGLSPFEAVPAARSSVLEPVAAPAFDIAPLIEARAVAVAAELGVVALGPDGAVCPADHLSVSWSEPSDAFVVGAHLAPIGPRPAADTTAVNGVVVCRDSTYAYMGFEASRVGDQWTVTAVPLVPHGPEDEATEEAHEHNDDDGGTPPPDPSAPSPAVALPAGIEGYAAYEGQSTCDPTPKPGLLAFRDTVLRKYPWTRSSGISRGCSVGGRSEHKEGRAWDWAVNVGRPDDRAAADEVVGWLLATDAMGNAHAMARRTGLMYVIWNRQMWAAYRAGAGWRPYQGPSAHTDHVHFSFSWAGARGQTSFFSGVVAELPTVIPTSRGFATETPRARRQRSSTPTTEPIQPERTGRTDRTERERRRRDRSTTTTEPTTPTTQPERTERERWRRRDRSTTTTTTVTAPADGSCRRRCEGGRRGRRARVEQTTSTTTP